MQDIPELVERNTVHSGFFDLHLDTVKHEEKGSLEFTVVSTKVDAATVLPLTEEGKFVITKEYRHPIKKFVYGLPGGRMEDGETPLQSAKRELKEETGYSATSYKKLAIYYPMPSCCDQKITLFLAKGCKKISTTNLDLFERIDTLELTLDELKLALKEGTDIDGILASTLYYYQLHS